jgi:hypothetical protein
MAYVLINSEVHLNNELMKSESDDWVCSKSLKIRFKNFLSNSLKLGKPKPTIYVIICNALTTIGL